LVGKINIHFIFIFFGFLAGCSIDIEITDKTLQSGTIDFSDADSFEFDENYVELIDGKVQLKPLDLEHSGDDFSRGSHVGSHVDASKTTLTLQTDRANEHNSSWTPKYGDIVGYWRVSQQKGQFGNSGTLQAEIGPDLISQSMNSSGVEIVDGQVGNAIHFSGDGDDEFLAPNANLEIYSLSVWIKFNDNRDSTTSSNTIIQKDGNEWFKVGGNGTGVCNDELISVANGSGNRSCWSDTNFTFDQTWHHLLFSWDASTQTYLIFLDGIQRPVVTFGTVVPLVFSSENMRFHVDQGRSFYIDELTLWDKSLSDAEGLAIYQKQKEKFSGDTSLSSSWTPKWNSIVGYWKMDGNWQDSSGNGNHGVALGGVTFDSITQKIGSNSGVFDGVDDYVELNTTSILEDKTFSISTWAKFSSTPSVWDIIFWQTESQLYLTPSNNISFRIQDASITTFGVTSPKPVSLNQWHHIGVIANNSTLQLYINGELVRSQDISALGDPRVSSFLVQMGNDESTTGWHDGQIDDFSIWNTSIKKSDMSLVYNRQKQKYASNYQSEVLDLGSTTSAWPDLSWATSLPFGKELVGDFDNNGIPDSESSSDYSGINESLNNGLIGYWNFNETIANSVLPGGEDFMDLSGKGHFGTETGGVLLNGNGNFGSSIFFDGIDDTVNFTAGPELRTHYKDDFSISIWLKIPENQIDIGNAVNRVWIRNTASGFDSLTLRNQSDGSSGQIDFRRFDGSASEVLLSTRAINDNQFHHILAKKKSGQMYLYIDGQLDDQRPDTTNLNEQFSVVRFGKNSGPTSALTGYIDESAIWNKALTDSEIRQLYRRGANRVKLQVKSCVDSSCNCKSFSSSPQGSVNDCDGDGIANVTDDNDIHQAEFMGPGGDGTTFFSELMNRQVEDIVFECDTNTTDSNDDVCVQDEILLTGSPKSTSPLFSFDDYLESAVPQPNRYFQYRVHMEADENAACDGEPCLPELTSVNLNPSGEPRYYGLVQTVTTKKPIPYVHILSATLEADSCATFQLSSDGSTFYIWNDAAWVTPASETSGTTAGDLTTNIKAFGEQFGAGNLYLRAFLGSENDTPCTFGNFQVETSELSAN